MLVPERLLDQMTAEERDRFNEAVEGWRYSIRGACPSCGMNLVSRLRLSGSFIAEDKEERTQPTPAKTQGEHYLEGRDRNRQAADQKFIDEAESSGMLAAFREAVAQLKPQQQPKDIGAFLLTFFRTYGEKVVPRDVFARYKDEFDGRLDFWSAQGIVAVLSDRVVRAFIPGHLIFGAPVRDARGKVKAVLGTDAKAFDVWVRGRHGYVPLGAPNFSEAMSHKNRGEFDTVRQS